MWDARCLVCLFKTYLQRPYTDSQATSLVPPTLHSAEEGGLMRSPNPLELCFACTFELLFSTINMSERAKDVAQW